MGAGYRQATLLFNYLYHEAARRDFWEEHLGAARDADPFVASLFDAWPVDAPDKPTLYLTRNEVPFQGVRLVQEQVLDSPCVTEMGHYTAHLREPGRSAPLIDELLGYLLRSKDAQSSEAFVLGDHSYLDAVTLT